MRYFEKISEKQFKKDFKDINTSYNDILLPKRATASAAGYDFYAPFSFSLKPGEIIMIPTGIKACLNNNEFLAIYVRSSMGFKYNIRMCNQVGIIDCDYYNNTFNEGHIFIKLQNEGNGEYNINKGDKICQGIIQQYYIVENDNVDNIRKGGLGSTDKGECNNE